MYFLQQQIVPRSVLSVFGTLPLSEPYPSHTERQPLVSGCHHLYPILSLFSVTVGQNVQLCSLHISLKKNLDVEDYNIIDIILYSG